MAVISELKLIRLPEEYQEVEYIESTGTQYINVGYIPEINDVYKLKFSFTSITGNQVIFGSRTSGTYIDSLNQIYLNKSIAVGKENHMLFFSGTTSQDLFSTEVNKIYELELSANSGNFDNNSSQPLHLFCFNVLGSSNVYSFIKLYKFEIINNNTVIRNLIPCYRKSDNVAGMYDLVEGKFYTNRGTGEFAVGNVVYPQNITKYNNATISNINFNGVDYHFAKNTESTGMCEDAVEEPIIDLKISGNSVQNGEPTPEAPVEIESVGEKTKNLIKPQDIFSVNTTGNSYSELVEDGRNCVRYIDAADGRYNGFKFKENTQYTVSAYVKTTIRTTSNTASSTWINFFYTDGTKSVSSIERDIDWTYKELTSTAGKTVQAIGIDSVNYTNWIYVDVDTFQIEEGATATDYEPYGYKVSVKVSGKNILNIQALKESTETWVVPAYKYTLKLKPNTQYTCSSNVPKPIDDSLDEKCLYFNGVTWDSGAGVCVGQPKTTTTDENGSLYIAICKGRTYSEDLINGKYYIQIEEGTIATDYEPYVEPQTYNIYLNEPLREIGDYADYIDYKNKKVVRNIKEMILTGDESWFYNSTYNAFCINDKNFKTGQTPLCTHLKGISAGILTNDNSLLINSTNIYIIRHDLGEDVNKLIDFLKSSNVKFINPLATPTEETIDIPEISTSKGTNNFVVETTILPSEFKLNYWKQIGAVEAEEEIIKNGSDILIIRTGATLTQSGSNLLIGE